jgi:23S rRNA (guanosine2251-2'-O)-methyltransferase
MEDTKSEYPAGNIFEQNFSGNTAIILGSEGNGISEKVLEKCDFITPIPMENKVESLNVSVAGAVAMYE